MLRRTITLASFLAAAPLTAQAQSNSILGKWNVEFPGPVRMENGERTESRSKGTMEIVEKGDSLIATLVYVAMEGTPPRTVRMAAAKSGGDASFTQKSQARMNMNGEESVHEITSTWKLHASGDALDGTLARTGDLPGFGGPPGDVKGTRAK